MSSILSKFKKQLLFILTSCIFLSSSLAIANSINVRVVILDQLMSEKLSSVIYQNDYLKGIKVARVLAKRQGINVIYKHFGYPRTALGILSVISKVKAWHPDFIIGPRSSNSMLLLKNQIKHILVVSPTATSPQIGKLPNNFYSFSLSDRYIAKALSIFTIHYFKPIKGVLSVSAEDCISCKNVSNLYLNNLKKLDPKIQTIERYFISSNVENINISSILSSYQKGYIIFTPNLSYPSTILVTRIINYLNKPNIIFIGSDGWGSHSISFIGKITAKYNFVAYHLQDRSMVIKTKQSVEFKKNFQSIFGYATKDNISYISYYTLNTILSVINKQKFSKAKSKQQYIFKAFSSVINNKRNYFKPRYYVIFEYKNENEKPVAIIDTKTWNVRNA